MKRGKRGASGTRTGLLGALAVALALAVGACGSGSGETTLPLDAPPREVAEVAGFSGVHSGSVEASLIVTKLKRDEAISFRANGGFDQLGEEPVPRFYVAATSQGRWNGREVNFNSLLRVLPSGAAISYGEGANQKSYEVPRPTLRGLKAKFEEAQGDGETGNVSACLAAAGEFDLSDLLRKPELEGRRKESDGTTVLLVKGAIDISALRNLFVKLARDPACGAQIEALGLPAAAKLEKARVDFKKGFGGPHLTLAVDRHGVIRELSTRFECARLNGEFFELQLNFNLREPNRATEVSSPGGEGKPLAGLLRQFGTTQGAALKAPGSAAVLAFLGGLGDALVGRRPGASGSAVGP